MPNETAAGRAYVDLVKAVHIKHGRPAECPLMAWVETMAHEAPAEIRRQMVAREDFPLDALFAALLDTVERHKAGDVGEIQAVYVDAIRARPFAQTRGFIERFLVNHGDQLGDAAAKGLAGHLGEHHPNPKAFLAQDRVRKHLPPDFDFSHFAAPDFRHLERQPMAGRRGEAERAPPPPRSRARPPAKKGAP